MSNNDSEVMLVNMLYGQGMYFEFINSQQNFDGYGASN